MKWSLGTQDELGSTSNQLPTKIIPRIGWFEQVRVWSGLKETDELKETLGT